MKINLRHSTVRPMLDILGQIKEGFIPVESLKALLQHEDYQMEFNRYSGRIDQLSFMHYLMHFPNLNEEDINNPNLKTHHAYYLDFIEKSDLYYQHLDVLDIDQALLNEQLVIAKAGLPDDLDLVEINLVFTIGIGQSFGYVHENYVHFDYLQLVKDKSAADFAASLAHEFHHVGMNIILKDVDAGALSMEALFYLYFAGEGLAVKYCNNAEGQLSKKLYDGEANVGLDAETWAYLNDDFIPTMTRFRETVDALRNKTIDTKEAFHRELSAYWMNPYKAGQDKTEVPQLKQFRLYSLGNEIWGIIHDVFGKEKVYETLRNPQAFPEVFNEALKRLNQSEYQI